MRAIFLDKDGTLIVDVPFNTDPELIQLAPRAGQALRLFRKLGYALFVVSNQSGIARGMFPEAALLPVQARIEALLAEQGVVLNGFFYCPHHPEGSVQEYALACECRKPMPGMILQAGQAYGIDLSRSWMIGDILDDVEAGHRAGCRTLLIANGNETEWQLSQQRVPDLIAPDLYQAARAIELVDHLKTSPLLCPDHGVMHT